MTTLTAASRPNSALLILPCLVDATELLASDIVGMNFLTRQCRLLAAGGFTQILLASDMSNCEDKGVLEVLHQCKSHWLFPVDISIELLSICDLDCHFYSNSDEHGQILIQRFDDVYEFSAYRLLIDCSQNTGSQNGLAIQSERGPWLINTNDADEFASHLVQSGDANLSNPGRAYLGRVDHLADIRNMEMNLWNSCRKEQDGFISRYFNRHISLALSQLIVATKITPNHVTIFGILLGLGAAYSASRGGYVPTLVGAILLQFVSIIDGVDGELARVRLQFSRLGEWLDTLGDDFVNIAFVLALAMGLWATGFEAIWLVLSFLGALTLIVVALLNYALIAQTDSGDILSLDWFQAGQSPPIFSRLWFEVWGGRLFRRDLLVAIILAYALFGCIEWSLIVILCVGLLTILAQIRRLFWR